MTGSVERGTTVSKGQGARQRVKRPLPHFAPYLFLLPAAIILAIFMFYPLIYTAYLSFFDWNMVSPKRRFVGLANYIALFQDPTFFKIFGNTIAYIALLLLFNCVAPFVFSFILSFVVKRGKSFYKGTIFLPSIISMVVGTMIFVWLLNPISGPTALIMSVFGMKAPIWSTTQGLVIVALSVMTSWKLFGYNFIISMAGVGGVPLEVVESARVDGIPLHRIFLNIVLPMSSATGIYVLILAIVQGLQQIFTPINMITKGGPDYGSSNMIYNVYNEAFNFFHTGTASAYAILMMALFAFLLFLEFRFVERGIYYEN